MSLMLDTPSKVLLADAAEAAKKAAKTGKYYVEISSLEQKVEDMKKQFGIKVRHCSGVVVHCGWHAIGFRFDCCA